jgi:hypothetical protein
MMMPSPDRIWWYYDVYQQMSGTVDGVEFVQGLPDFDALDPAEKHLIIINDGWRTQFFMKDFARATAKPHGYMVIDMKQDTPTSCD